MSIFQVDPTHHDDALASCINNALLMNAFCKAAIRQTLQIDDDRPAGRIGQRYTRTTQGSIPVSFTLCARAERKPRERRMCTHTATSRQR